MAVIKYRYRWGRYVVASAALGVAVLGVIGTHDTFTAAVVAVHDGDTFTVNTTDGLMTIRLWGVDCPEVRQSFGNIAAAWAAYELTNARVQLEVKERDRYGRLVCKVTMPDGRDLGELIVEEGLGWWYRQYAPKESVLGRLEGQAQRERVGLWADERPVPPWQFRAAHRR